MKKSPDTQYFTWFNANPKNSRTTDCVSRALSLAMKRDYKQVVHDLADIMCDTGFDFHDDKCYEKYLEANGWVKLKQPKKCDGTKYRGNELCEELQRNDCDSLGCGVYYDTSRIIAHMGSHHIVCIIDGKIMDTWNSGRGCVGKLWVRKAR